MISAIGDLPGAQAGREAFGGDAPLSAEDLAEVQEVVLTEVVVEDLVEDQEVVVMEIVAQYKLKEVEEDLVEDQEVDNMDNLLNPMSLEVEEVIMVLV